MVVGDHVPLPVEHEARSRWRRPPRPRTPRRSARCWAAAPAATAATEPFSTGSGASSRVSTPSSPSRLAPAEDCSRPSGRSRSAERAAQQPDDHGQRGDRRPHPPARRPRRSRPVGATQHQGLRRAPGNALRGAFQGPGPEPCGGPDRDPAAGRQGSTLSARLWAGAGAGRRGAGRRSGAGAAGSARAGRSTAALRWVASTLSGSVRAPLSRARHAGSAGRRWARSPHRRAGAAGVRRLRVVAVLVRHGTILTPAMPPVACRVANRRSAVTAGELRGAGVQAGHRRAALRRAPPWATPSASTPATAAPSAVPPRKATPLRGRPGSGASPTAGRRGTTRARARP